MRPFKRSPGRAVVASAARLTVGDPSKVPARKPKPLPQQIRALEFYDGNRLIKYGFLRLGATASRVRLFVGVSPLNDDDEPVEISEALDPQRAPGDTATGPLVPGLTPALAQFATEQLARLDRYSVGGHPELVRLMTIGLGVPGECYLVGEEPRLLADGTMTEERWQVVALDAIRERNAGSPMARFEILDLPGALQGRELDPATSTVIRIWRSHPHWPRLADSSVLGLLNELEEMRLLQMGNSAIAKSRVAQAGLLLVDQERVKSVARNMTRSRPGDVGDAVPFEDVLFKIFEAAIGQPDDASAVVPAVVFTEGELDKVMHHLQLERPHDAAAAARLIELTTEISQGIDLPPEMLTGLGKTATHATGRQISKDSYSNHVAPTLLLETQALTDAWLRPACIEAGYDPEVIARLCVAPDPSSIIGDENKVENAFKAAAIGAVGLAYVRTTIGASDNDAATPEDIATMQAVSKAPAAGGSPDNPNSDTSVTGSSRRRSIDDATVRAHARRRLAAAPLALPAAPLVASARMFPDLGQRLATIDQALLERIRAASETAVNDAVRLAGARLRSRAQGHAELRTLLRNVRADAVGRTLGHDRALSLGVDDDELFAGAFEDLSNRYDTHVARAQATALAAVASAAGTDIDGIEDDDTEQQRNDDRHAGAALLVGALAGIASAQLYGHSVEHPLPTGAGEYTPELSVQPGVVRASLARAGGTPNPESTPVGGVLTDLGGRPAGLVATGQTIEGLLASALGAVFGGYSWVYGDPSSRGTVFDPHFELDGVSFTAWDDDVLTNFGPWPPVPYLYPGDHLYCQCAFAPDLVSADSAAAGDVTLPPDADA